MSTASRTAPSSRPTFSSWFLLILANVLWAVSYVASKFALEDVSVTFMLALRMAIAALVLLPMLIFSYKQLKLNRRTLIQLGMLSLGGFVLNKLLEFGGLALTTASDVALLITSESIFTAVLSWLLLRERFQKWTAAMLLLGFAGVYLIVAQGLIPVIPSGGGTVRVIGNLLVIAGLLVEAFFTIRSKALLTQHSPLLITAATIIGSSLFWIPVGGWEVMTTGWPEIGVAAWLGILWLALLATALAYFAWFKGLERIDGSKAASTLFIQPLLGTLLAVVLLHEALSPMTIIGGILIIVSVYLISKQPST